MLPTYSNLINVSESLKNIRVFHGMGMTMTMKFVNESLKKKQLGLIMIIVQIQYIKCSPIFKMFFKINTPIQLLVLQKNTE